MLMDIISSLLLRTFCLDSISFNICHWKVSFVALIANQFYFEFFSQRQVFAWESLSTVHISALIYFVSRVELLTKLIVGLPWFFDFESHLVHCFIMHGFHIVELSNIITHTITLFLLSPTEPTFNARDAEGLKSFGVYKAEPISFMRCANQLFESQFERFLFFAWFQSRTNLISPSNGLYFTLIFSQGIFRRDLFPVWYSEYMNFYLTFFS